MKTTTNLTTQRRNQSNSHRIDWQVLPSAWLAELTRECHKVARGVRFRVHESVEELAQDAVLSAAGYYARHVDAILLRSVNSIAFTACRLVFGHWWQKRKRRALGDASMRAQAQVTSSADMDWAKFAY